MREYSTHTAFLGTSRAASTPGLPAWRFHLDGYRHFNWRSSEKHSETPLQSKYKALATKMKQSACPGLRKNVKLPALEHPDASHWLKGGGTWNDPHSNMRSDSHLRGKYTYLHFSSPVRLEVKPPPPQARHNFPLGHHRHLRLGLSADPTVQNLMINGVTVPLTRTDQCRRPKMEIHVYVPSGKKEDAELLDDAFSEETDKLNMLSLEDSIL